MVDVPFHLMSEFERAFFEAEPDASDRRHRDHSMARQRFANLIEKVEWREGTQSRIGFGPVGPCLVAWVDAYPVIAFPEPDASGCHHGIAGGHGSFGGATAAGMMLNMLAFVARNPDGRRDSDSQWLRKGGKAGFCAFYGVDPKDTNTRTMETLLAEFNAAPEASRMGP